MKWLKSIKTAGRWHWFNYLASGSLLLVSTGCNWLGKQSGYESQAVDEVAASSGYAAEETYAYHKHDLKRHPDIGKAAIPSPPGTYVNPWYDEQICSARRYDYVISRYEWYSGGGELGPEGKLHVRKLAEALLSCPDRVILEAEPVEISKDETLEDAEKWTAELNENRKQVVIAVLVEHGVSDAEERVFVAPLDRVGVHGIEAPRIYNQLFFGGGGRGGQQGGFGGGRGGFGNGIGSGFGSGGGFY